MTQPSNIRQLLTDTKLGLLPHLDNRIDELEKKLKQEYQNLQIQTYNLQFGDCSTLSANEPRPLITQLISLEFFIAANAEDKLELFLLASELQNTVDAAIYEWSNQEWHQFEKPLKRPVTQITGGLDYQLLENSATSCRISIYREFGLTYPVIF
jgi:hypothetical protein